MGLAISWIDRRLTCVLLETILVFQKSHLFFNLIMGVHNEQLILCLCGRSDNMLPNTKF